MFRSAFCIVALVLVTFGCGGPATSGSPDAQVDDMLDASADLLVSLDAPPDLGLDGGIGTDAPGATDAVGDVAADAPDATPCPAGQTLCGDACFNFETDPFHCGRCDRNCRLLPGVNISTPCERGTCAVRDHCTEGFADCDSDPMNGCETSLADPTHCGACSTVCTGTTPVCAMVSGDGGASRACTNGCTAMTPTRCGGTCADTQTDPMNCGGCGVACAARPGTMARCEAGACVYTCAFGRIDCDRDPSTGCEVDPVNDRMNCGACGRACTFAHATASCMTSSCTLEACTTGFDNCDGVAGNGCETDLTTSTDNCGRCGRSCSLPNAMAGCAAGSCTVAACTSGFGNCNMNPADGCETDLRTSLSNCGRCGHGCFLAGAVSTCTDAACAISYCTLGFGNCDGNPANGCETWYNALTSCGSCTRSCPTGGPHTVATCTGPGTVAVCGLACESGWRDCDSNLGNGCETTGSCTRAVTLFSEDFESTLSRWTLDPPWRQWDGAFGGRIPYRGRSSLFAVTAGVPCRTEGYATMTSDIDAREAVSLGLYFASYDFRGRADGYAVEVSTNRGSTWTPISSFYLFTTADWESRSVDLTAFAGSPTLRFRFYYLSICSGPYMEWDIDDVSVQALVRNY